VALERRVDLEQVVPAGGVRPLSDVAAEALQLSTVVLVRLDVELSDGLGPPGGQAENPEQPFDPVLSNGVQVCRLGERDLDQWAESRLRVGKNEERDLRVPFHWATSRRRPSRK
jgi:hypothetical protein